MSKTALLSVIFECLPFGALLVDPEGNIQGCNRAAKDLLERKVLLADGSRIEHSVRFRSRRRVVERITCGGDSSGHAFFQPAEGGTIVFMICPSTDMTAVDTGLRQVYNLTPQERRVAVRLYEGDSLAECAQSLDVELSTARTHLKSIFGKTNTRRQTQLVRVIASFAFAVASVPPDEGRARHIADGTTDRLNQQQ